MIHVCDAIMGTGKSSAAITYMNEHPEDRFIYITPYLEEAARIREGCPELHFVEPSNKLQQYAFKKCEHTAALIKQGRNITTTHQSFKMYTDEMLRDIRRCGYILIIDENIDVLERYDCHPDDIQMTVDAGYVKEDNGTYSLVNTEYHGVAFHDLFKFMRNRSLIRLGDSTEDGEAKHFFYWALPPDLILSFKETIILTYLFEGQMLHHFLETYHLPYIYIGIQKDGDEKFRFSDYPGYTPEYVKHLPDMIHIVDSKKLNQIGEDNTALSMSWYNRKNEAVKQLKKNVYNCVNNIWRGEASGEKLWGCFKTHEGKIAGKGYTKSFLTFNARATNEYRNRRYLMYIVNVFMNVGDKRFYQSHGIKVDEDKYALSIMVQWIWRSAIRDGDEIYLYIPSKRMRTLLQNWIAAVSGGGG